MESSIFKGLFFAVLGGGLLLAMSVLHIPEWLRGPFILITAVSLGYMAFCLFSQSGRVGGSRIRGLAAIIVLLFAIFAFAFGFIPEAVLTPGILSPVSIVMFWATLVSGIILTISTLFLPDNIRI